MKTSRRVTLAGSAVGIAALALAGPVAGISAADAHAQPHNSGHSREEAQLGALNNSGVTGSAEVRVRGNRVRVNVWASGLLPDAPHAMHIHFGEEARHECPTVALDTNHDHRLNVAEGLPAYGPIAASLTTSGDTSPASGLAVTRYPTAPNGMIEYSRTFMVTPQLASAISKGEAVVVIHGLDYNGNKKYDFGGAGASELNAALPAEATDPATCGVLK
jgi:hypothetical protein